MMKAGLDLLYARDDPAGAAVQFRMVLAVDPAHYGATYQLATALDRSGKPDEARQYWEKMLSLAEAAKDEATASAARKRLGVPAPTSGEGIQLALMRAGLDAMYTRKDPNAAAVEFRKVLERNPTHYGATYQLASALDRSGKRGEARPLWEKVVKMAEGYKDQNTLDIARARLAQRP
jgi:cytochrome c-type biogenesis protein CcmH/NrfG